MKGEVNCAEGSGTCAETVGASTCERTPRVDIVETAEEFRVDVEMPGVGPDGVDVELENGLLKIQGKSAPSRDAGRAVRVREWVAGDYVRSLRLSDSIDTGRIAARARDGLLTLHLPKVGAVKPRSIPVEKSS